MFKRILKPSLTRSFFLFGPRSTGKSTLLNEMLPESAALWIDLLDPDTERELAKSPSRLATILEGELASNRKRKWVVIDEVQKVPELLTVVHKYIQKSKFFFALTGSSARKLKRNNADLLGGRASWFELSSLSHIELGKKFDLNLVLQWGSLPEIFELSDEDRYRFLKAYANIYLKEEIVAEQLVRKVQPFRNFLELVALQNAQIINYSKFANDCGVDITTIQSYFEILIDTLIGFELQPFRLSIRKRQRTNPKFYFFDTGVLNSLLERKQTSSKTKEYGNLFEHFILNEIRAYVDYNATDTKLNFWRVDQETEVDIIINHTIAIEIKSTDNVVLKHLKGLKKFAHTGACSKQIVVSRDPMVRQIDEIQVLPYQDFLQKLWAGDIF